MKRYSETERALIATVVSDLGFTESQNFLSGKSPTYATLRTIAEEYDLSVPMGQRGRPAGSKNTKSKKRGRPAGSKNTVKRGRPRKTKRGRRYTEEDRAKLVTLIEKHGLTGTMKVLGDASPSIVTLCNIAKGKVTLTRGRPVKEAA